MADKSIAGLGTSPAANKKLYDNWAPQYEADVRKWSAQIRIHSTQRALRARRDPLHPVHTNLIQGAELPRADPFSFVAFLPCTCPPPEPQGVQSTGTLRRTAPEAHVIAPRAFSCWFCHVSLLSAVGWDRARRRSRGRPQRSACAVPHADAGGLACAAAFLALRAEWSCPRAPLCCCCTPEALRAAAATVHSLFFCWHCFCCTVTAAAAAAAAAAALASAAITCCLLLHLAEVPIWRQVALKEAGCVHTCPSSAIPTSTAIAAAIH